MKVIRSIISLLFVSCISFSMEKDTTTPSVRAVLVLGNGPGEAVDLSKMQRLGSVGSFTNQHTNTGQYTLGSNASTIVNPSSAHTNTVHSNTMHSDTTTYQSGNATTSQQHSASSLGSTVMRQQRNAFKEAREEQLFEGYDDAELSLQDRPIIYHSDVPIQTLANPDAQASDLEAALTSHAQQPPVQKRKYITAPQDVMRAYNTSRKYEDHSPSMQPHPALYASILAQQRGYLNKNPHYIATLEARDFVISIIDNLANGNYITVDDQLRNHTLSSAVPELF